MYTNVLNHPIITINIYRYNNMYYNFWKKFTFLQEKYLNGFYIKKKKNQQTIKLIMVKYINCIFLHGSFAQNRFTNEIIYRSLET